MEIVTLDGSGLDEVKSLWEQLNQHHQQVSTYFKAHFAGLTFEKRKLQLLKKDKLKIFLASDNTGKIGYCVASINNDIGEIDSLYVRSDKRNQKTATQMVLQALEWLKENGCSNTAVHIAEGNEESLGFYSKFGFAPRFIVMQQQEEH